MFVCALFRQCRTVPLDLALDPKPWEPCLCWYLTWQEAQQIWSCSVLGTSILPKLMPRLAGYHTQCLQRSGAGAERLDSRTGGARLHQPVQERVGPQRLQRVRVLRACRSMFLQTASRTCDRVCVAASCIRVEISTSSATPLELLPQDVITQLAAVCLRTTYITTTGTNCR